MNFDTITAIATASGVGGIGIIRLSGSEALKIAKKIFKVPNNLKSHEVIFGKIIDEQELIDSCLLIYFKAPKSFTGEDVIEFHCHGNPFILNKVLDLCIKYGARLAKAGEFTKRAFLNGKLDLTQAEAVYDLIHSKTSMSLKNANNQIEGKLSSKIKNVRDELIKTLSHIEAIIDFPDEIDDEPLSNFIPVVNKAYDLVVNLINTAEAGKIYRDGIKTAIVGKPNVGKSSLLNSLLRFDRAIVTDIEGTTRDTLEEYINIKGIPVQIVDTAGLRETSDIIEKIGIEKSFESIDKSQLVLFVADGSKNLSEEEIRILNKLEEENKSFIMVINKIDLTDNFNLNNKNIENIAFISAKYNKGIEKLEELIKNLILKGKTDSSLDININSRHKEILYRAKESLVKSLDTINKNLPIDFLAIDIKAAIVNMGEIIGENVSEEVITEIFANFCVGK
ncbi:MAG: tRNA uridine-5-carboxymethylaminomethyl(34) synthesis GTPase MnmE [Candidatus Sericytochromatia bacterium]